MNSSGLIQEIKKHPWILVMVITFHLGLAVLLGINLTDNTPVEAAEKSHKIINAVVIDAKKYDQQIKKKKQAEINKKRREKDKQLKAKRLKDKQIKDKQLKDKQLKDKQLKDKQLAEIKRQKKLLADKRRQENIAQKKAAQKKLAQKRQKKVAEKRRLVLEKQKKLAAKKLARKRAEAEKKRREAEKADLKQALKEEQQRQETQRLQAVHAAKMASLRSQYVKLIAQKVENNWLRPTGSAVGQSCDVIVTQTYTGDVVSVQLQSCQANNAFQRSVERAVQSASPLPLPPAPEVFDRKIYFTFRPDK